MELLILNPYSKNGILQKDDWYFMVFGPPKKRLLKSPGCDGDETSLSGRPRSPTARFKPSKTRTIPKRNIVLQIPCFGGLAVKLQGCIIGIFISQIIQDLVLNQPECIMVRFMSGMVGFCSQFM